ncbi:MAG: amino acid ABC transporter substrate-binding protein [Burkholderiales bacterium]|nr:amino acid ABC transporter substrate-binding protein [Burkholderiales bacterium]MCE7876054.1 ABC transporter substrate-binding protein [Betaproteobacteria bacterium PRO3]
MSSRTIRMLATGLALAGMTVAFPALAQSRPDIVIGALLPLTGPPAPVGLEQQQGVQFAVDRVNARGGLHGHKVRVAYEDSQGKPDVAVLSFNRLLDLENVPLAITAFSSVSLAIAPIATRRKVVLLNAAAQSNKLENASPFLFNTIPLVKDETGAITNYLYRTLGKKTAAVIYENVAAGIDGKDDFKRSFEALGGKVLAEEPVEFGLTNYRPTLLKAAAAKPDVVFVVITQGHPTFVEQAAQTPGLPVVAGTTFVNPLCCYAGSAGWYQSAIKSDIAPEIRGAFVSRYKTKDMGFFAREYFNATDIGLQAIDHVLAQGKPVTGEAVRDAIFAIKTFRSSVGDVTFDRSNTAKRGVEIQQYAADSRKVLAVEGAK